jgi:hypothetical protein
MLKNRAFDEQGEKPEAMPHKAVIALQMIIEIDKTLTRLQRSVSAAIGMPRVA